jgi:outer membrane protein insertion porin family
MQLQWDRRDKLINTRQGDYFQFFVSANPAGGFSQAGFDLRRFARLRRSLVLGSRALAGATQGRPSYLFRYRLGGLDTLRGYKDNRFRGSEFFVIQEELRWLLKKWLSINVSADLGGIRDDAYRQLKATAQAGLRLGLPPDWGQKLRVDFGVGADQATFQIQFGEIF